MIQTQMNNAVVPIRRKRRRPQLRTCWTVSSFLVLLTCCTNVQHRVITVVQCFHVPAILTIHNHKHYMDINHYSHDNLNWRKVSINVREHPCHTENRHRRLLLQSKRSDLYGDIDSNSNNSNHNNTSNQKQEQQKYQNIAQRVVSIYSEYAKRLWNETSIYERQRVNKDQLASSIRQVQSNLKSIAASTSLSSSTMIATKTTAYESESVIESDSVAKDKANDNTKAYIDLAPTALDNLLAACDEVLKGLQQRASSQQRVPVSKSPKSMSTKNDQSSVTTILIPSTVPLTEINGAYGTTTTASATTNAISVGTTKSRLKNDPLPNSDNELISYEPNGLKKDVSSDDGIVAVPTKKKSRSVAFGAMMGAVVALWVFSGNYIFTGLFTLMTILGQLEFYRMIMNTGVSPARRISVLGACSMFLSALLCPDLHQICLPMFGLWTMVWFLTVKRTASTIAEIATTFTGMFYLGYVPSFWVRIRLLGPSEPTRLAPVVGPILKFIRVTAEQVYILPKWAPQAIHLPITTGSVFIFWTWLSLAFSDVGAYFVGKRYGKTKLHVISPAAGATSPNKTVEGVIGGCVVSAMFAIVGAWVQRWPYPLLSGTIHGVLLGMLGLIGDLTASMLKRDAGLKDFGDLLPEHGGILDRVDSFIWSAPYSWLVCAYIIPALKNAFR